MVVAGSIRTTSFGSLRDSSDKQRRTALSCALSGAGIETGLSPTAPPRTVESQHKHCCRGQPLLSTLLPVPPPSRGTQIARCCQQVHIIHPTFDRRSTTLRGGTSAHTEGQLGRPGLHSAHHHDCRHAVGLSGGVFPADDHAISVPAGSDVIVEELLLMRVRHAMMMIAFHVVRNAGVSSSHATHREHLRAGVEKIETERGGDAGSSSNNFACQAS